MDCSNGRTKCDTNLVTYNIDRSTEIISSIGYVNIRLVPSETQCLLENISLGRTDALSAHRLFRTILSLTQPFNARYAVEYLFFARILALCRARGITIPTIRLGVIECKLPKRIVGIVIPRARHSAKLEQNHSSYRKKAFPTIAHLCSKMAVFGRKSTFRQA
jgi:hypothetical protein